MLHDREILDKDLQQIKIGDEGAVAEQKKIKIRLSKS